MGMDSLADRPLHETELIRAPRKIEALGHLAESLVRASWSARLIAALVHRLLTRHSRRLRRWTHDFRDERTKAAIDQSHVTVSCRWK